MSETVEFEINRQLKNYVVIVKNMSEDREKVFTMRTVKMHLFLDI